MSSAKTVLATSASAHLLEEISRASIAGITVVRHETKVFKDGERYTRIDPQQFPLQDRDVVVIGATPSGEDLLELADLVTGVVGNEAARVTVIIPWFGYQTMDRATKHGEVVTAKVRARLIAGLPRASSRDSVVVVDGHFDTLHQWFDPWKGHHLYCEPLILGMIRDAADGDLSNVVLGTTDGSRSKWTEAFAKKLKVPLCIALSIRQGDGKKRAYAIDGSLVNGKHVILHDDMFRSIETSTGAADGFLLAGAAKVSAVGTHGNFTGYGTAHCALTQAQAAGKISRIFCTNSHPRAEAIRVEGKFDGFLSVYPMGAPVIGEYLTGKLHAF